VKVTGPLSTNHGEMAVQWARDGHGIVLRSLWDVAADLQAGSLVQLLPEWQQQANIWAVYPTRLERSAKVRVCVEFLQEFFSKQAPTGFRNAIKKKLLSIDIHEFQSLFI
jgi:LysR family transcriptional activator of dmlA